MTEKDRLSLIALGLIPGIGGATVRSLISYCGSPSEVMSRSERDLRRIPGIGKQTVAAISRRQYIGEAETILEKARDGAFQVLTYYDEQFPRRLKDCPDTPMWLYYRGRFDLNHTRMLAIVGSRKATHYGLALCRDLVKGLAACKLCIVSGLAYGIDIAAHRAALEWNLPTVGVLAHGLDIIYPAVHSKVARQMEEQGGLLSEYPWGCLPDRKHFPMRNRIIAGMTDGVLVVETAPKGGAVLTANLANSYHRDVMACPGNVYSTYSAGCHKLIKEHRAHLIDRAEDILSLLNWEEDEKSVVVQPGLFDQLGEEYLRLRDLLAEEGSPALEVIWDKLPYNRSTIASMLLHLEMEGLIQSLPGNRFCLISQT